MSNWDYAIDYVLRNEGVDVANGRTGWVNDPDDLGGATNFGITIGLARRHGIETVEELKAMTLDRAKCIYKAVFWRGDYEYLHQDLAAKLLDVIVNFGEKNGLAIIQDAANLLSYSPKLVVDGRWGPATRRRLMGIEPDAMYRAISVILATEYHQRVVARPNQAKFFIGWLRRAARHPRDGRGGVL